MEIRTLTNDEQSYRFLRHITDHPDQNILINGVPGLGKTTLAATLALLYGQNMVEGTSYGKNCVDGMIDKGITHCQTVHARCLQYLMGSVLKTKLFALLDKKEQVKRETERMKKAASILNTMFPPKDMNEDSVVKAIAHSSGNTIRQELDDVLSLHYKVYSKFITIIMDAAMTARFGLKAMHGLKNSATGTCGYMPDGPNVNDSNEWRKLARSKFIDEDLIESLQQLESDQLEELYAFLQQKTGNDEIDLHSAVLNEFFELCPKVFNNMFDFFNTGSILLPNGQHTTRVWIHNDQTGEVVYTHRSLITYQEMMWVARKLNIKLMTRYVAAFYIDEWNDLTPLHLDVLMKIHNDAVMIARLCNKMPMQMLFGGDVGQMIYAFQGSMEDPMPCIVTAFAIQLQHCLIGDKSHRLPDAVIDYTNELCFRYPDAFLDPHKNVIQLRSARAGRQGEVKERVNIDELELPATVDLGQRGDAIPADVLTVAALARNQKDVDEFFQAQVAKGEDWMLRLSGRLMTTRQVLLDQLSFFQKNYMQTVEQMKAWLASKEHVISYSYQRKCFTVMLAKAEGTEQFVFPLVVLEAYIKAHWCFRPSKITTTMHGAKGEEYKWVLILKPEAVPSGKAISVQHSHASIYHAEMHLLYVAYTRAMIKLFISETQTEKEQREKVEAEGSSSQESMFDALSSRVPEMLTDQEVATPDVLKLALNVLKLDGSPKTLRELSVYVKAKRKHTLAIPDVDTATLDEFDRAAKVVRRSLLFSSPGVTCQSLAVSASQVFATNTAGGTNMGAGSNEALVEPVQPGFPANEAAPATDMNTEEVENLLLQLEHLNEDQKDIARAWLQHGHSITIADAAAISYHTHTEHEKAVKKANEDGQELVWQQVLATALGAGEWAGDWHKRHQELLVANDQAFAEAMANVSEYVTL